MTPDMLERIQGCAVGAAIGDALGMPLEFGPAQPLDHLVRTMLPGRIPAGSFTDDTEMALALGMSLLAHRPLDPTDLAQRFVEWYAAEPPDVGIQTGQVLAQIRAGTPWEEAVAVMQHQRPNSAGNGSLMRCWPVALAWWDDLPRLRADSRLQSQVTHPHADCVAACELINTLLYFLLRGVPPQSAYKEALAVVDDLPTDLRETALAAPGKARAALPNSGWVRHTLESALWGLLTTASFEEAVVAVVNLGSDADTAGAVVGALAGAAYGLSAIPVEWRAPLQGHYPLQPPRRWQVDDLAALAERLARRTP